MAPTAGFASLVFTLIVAGCDNMKDQPNRRPLDPSPHFADGASTRPLPPHTIARGQGAETDPVATGALDGHPLARSPVPFTRELLVRGRERFTIYCAACHGEDGYGTGIVVRRGFPPAPSYHDDRLRNLPDGTLFDAITRGYGVMPSFADRIDPHDRWALVGYIRALQRSQHATLADVPESPPRRVFPAMNPPASRPTKAAGQALAVIAGVALLIATLLGWTRPAAILPVCRLAIFACLAPAVGSVLFALIHRSTGGEWGDSLQPFLAAGCRLAPWLWLCVLPLLFLAPAPAAGWPDYESRGMVALRAAAGAVVLFAIATPLARQKKAAAWLGPVGLIVLVFTLHLLADDWLMALEPQWRSTAFPLVWMLGQAVAGLACAILFALLCGISARASTAKPHTRGLDWGNLLLTSMLLWAYVAFAQFLIIWAGNLPDEISWFDHRMHGGWRAVPGLLALLHFLVPLAILLSRRLKQSAGGLAAAAGTLLLAQIVSLSWIILPAFPAMSGWTLTFGAAACAGVFALFLNRYLATALRHL